MIKDFFYLIYDFTFQPLILLSLLFTLIFYFLEEISWIVGWIWAGIRTCLLKFILKFYFLLRIKRLLKFLKLINLIIQVILISILRLILFFWLIFCYKLILFFQKVILNFKHLLTQWTYIYGIWVWLKYRKSLMINLYSSF